MTQKITYTDDYIIASERLRLVLAFLSKYKIPASPVNYQVVYDFISGNNDSLKATIDKYIESKTTLSEEDLINLHDRFIRQDDSALETIRAEVDEIIHNMKSEYAHSNENLAAYLDSLNRFSDILSSPKNSNALATETRKVEDDTRSTEHTQRKFEKQISGMMDEMETLRTQLIKVRKESLTDALTGLANRNAFNQFIQETIEKFKENESPFCAVLGDIDHFKKFNDDYGHLVGDKVLRFVGKTLKSCVKGKDLAARYGGEEFVLILPDTDISGGLIVAQQIREAISAKTLYDHTTNEHYGKITISLGIGLYTSGESAEDLLHRADKALYKAKANGRNRVESA